MVRRLLAAALLALLLITAGCLGTTATAQPGPDATGRTIDVAAQGSVTAAPDRALVNLAVEVRADAADEARAQVAADHEAMREALRAIGITDDAVRTTSYFVGPEYDYDRGERELVGYQAYHVVQVETRVDRAGEVIDAAVENGASQVQGVQFMLADGTRAELRSEALAAAMASARADAETIASAAGVGLGDLQSASTTNVDYPRPYAVAAEGGGDGARTVLEPGPVTVSASVSVSYAIR